MKKKILRFICCLMLLSVFLAAQGNSANADDTKQFDELVSEFFEANRINENNFSFAYYNTATGETHMFNENRLMYAASVYKLPLSMYYYEQIALGNISPNSRYSGYSLKDCLMLSLRYSDNETAQAMRRAIGTFADFRAAIEKYTGEPEAEFGWGQANSHYFTASQILNTLKHLYDNSEFFAEAIGHLKVANPGQYFKRFVTEYEIAQKYGYWLPSINTAGIVYTPTPYLLVVFTEGLGETVIGRFNELVCNYTVTKNHGWTPTITVDVTLGTSNVVINGAATELESFNIDGSNYFKLRDIAFVLNGTEKRFSARYDYTTSAISLTSGQPYISVGSEMTKSDVKNKVAVQTTSRIFLNGAELNLAAYNIEGNNYFRMRDLMNALDVNVRLDAAKGTIILDTSRRYAD